MEGRRNEGHRKKGRKSGGKEREEVDKKEKETWKIKERREMREGDSGKKEGRK